MSGPGPEPPCVALTASMLGWYVGSIPAAAVTFGTNYLTSDLSWQVPLILQAVAAGAVCVMIWWCPESPRWMMAQGREDEAYAFLVKYRESLLPWTL